MKRTTAYVTAAILTASAMLAGCARGRELPMTTLSPKSDLAEWIYRLLIEVTLWDTLVFVVVITIFVLGLFVFSTRVGEAAPPSTAESDLKLEVAWTLGPALILLMITIPTIRTIFRSQPNLPPAGSLQIEVVAHQWWWEFHYGDKNQIVTANELHIPTGVPIRLNLRSADVIHSFWVPQLGGKRDVVPGQMNELTFIATIPGMYPGQCAEFCGESHANMRMRVFVETPQQFAEWEKVQVTAPPAAASITDPAAAAGAQAFANSPCTTCHRIDGVSKGYMGPDLTHFGSRTTMAGAIEANNPADVAQWITNPAYVKPGAEMPALGLSGKNLDDLVAYLESLK
ncbi:MAG TPA: cytochrome c oxidase subunit II [Candidatus Binataceae bacterium]|nr:cytochrome c oxidase subunit II [Candidatus Binataceae bacterium]